MWIKGTIDGYSFYIKQYDEGSEYGICRRADFEA